MTEEENVNKITFANYFGGIKRFKWWVLGATIISTLAGYLLINFSINKNREELKSEFSYTINLHTDKLTDKNDLSYSEQTQYFADNSIYNYSDIISEDHLKAVKNSNDEYKNVNVSALLSSNAIQLERMSYTDSVSGKTIYLYPERYILTIKNKFFKNSSQCKLFIRDLINYELQIAANANNSYEIPYYITDSFASMTLNKKLESLEKQYDVINSTYKSLTKEFAEGSYVGENVTLGSKYNSFLQKNAAGAFTIYSQLKNEYYSNHYITPDVDTEEVLVARAEEFKKNIKDSLINISIYEDSMNSLIQNTTIITGESKNELQETILKLNADINEEKIAVYKAANELKNLGYVVPEDSTEITLANVNSIVLDESSEAKGSIQYIKGKNTPANWEENCKAFVKKINDTVPLLQNDNSDCTNAYHHLYNTYKNKANFYTTNFAVIQKSINVVYGLLIGFIGGFLVSSLVAMGIHISKPIKAKEK